MHFDELIRTAAASICESTKDTPEVTRLWVREYIADVVFATEIDTLLLWLTESKEDLKELSSKTASSNWITQTKEITLNVLTPYVDRAVRAQKFTGITPLNVQEVGRDCVYFFSQNKPVICVDRKLLKITDTNLAIVTLTLPEFRLIFKASSVNFSPENLYALRNSDACSVPVQKAFIRSHARLPNKDNTGTPRVVQALNHAIDTGRVFVESYGDSLKRLLTGDSG